MALSLFARRVALGAIGSVAARTAHPATLSVVTRRTLFATPQFNVAPADSEASQKTAKKTTRKAAGKKATRAKRATPAKRGRPPKKPADHQDKQPKQEKQKGTHTFRPRLARAHRLHSPHTKPSQAPQACTRPLLPFLCLFRQVSPPGEHSAGVPRTFQACW